VPQQFAQKETLLKKKNQFKIKTTEIKSSPLLYMLFL